MVIEKLQMQHVDQVTALQKTLIPFETSFENAAETYGRMVKRDDYFLAVAREGEEILGTITGICCQGLGVRFLVLEDLVVKETLRGSGIGTQLMAAVDDFGRKKGCAYVFLVSSGFRKQAHKFYEKLGYTADVRGFRKEL